MNKLCEICGSNKWVQLYHNDKCLCGKHRHHMDRYGFVKNGGKFNINEIVEHDTIAIIYLYNAHLDKIAEIIIDKEDIEKINKYRWHLNNGYAKTTINKRTTSIHRIILNLTDENLVVDHIDGNPLNNRKCNLRICTQLENAKNVKISSKNKSGAKGIVWNKQNNNWRAIIFTNGKQINLGSYADFNEAVRARKEAEEKYFGEFVRDRGDK